MTFDSVRVTHALAVANHYITNQIYIPTDEDHKNRGSFLILLDNLAAKDGTFNASLVNILIREYYRNPSEDRLSVFEQALVRVNHALKTQVSAETDTASHQLHGCIALLCGGEIHLTYIGLCHAFLQRQKQLITLIDGSIEDSPMTGFSVITSGEIHTHDILILATPHDSSIHLEDDVAFALQHDPLFESGRSLARLFKQKHLTDSESLFIRFTEGEAESHQQIYTDRPLESSHEKLDQLQKKTKQHIDYVFAGVHFLTQKALGLARPQKQPLPVIEPTYDAFVADDATEGVETLPDMVETLAPMPQEPRDYSVTNYWEKASKVPAPSPKTPDIASDDTDDALAAVPLATDVLPPQGHRPQRVIDYSQAARPKQRLALPRIPWQSGVAVGLVTLVVIGLLGWRVMTSLRNPAAPILQSTTERDSLIAQAETELRSSDAAQIQDNIATAITHILAAQAALAKISQQNQNEQAKALTKQANDSLARLTQTTVLTTTASVDLPEVVTNLVATSSGSYAFLKSGAISQIKDNAATTMPSGPTFTELIDAVAYDNQSKVAFLATTAEKTQLYSLNTQTNAITELTRSDAKAWPETVSLSSFQTNLYFVGPTMFKGTLSQDKYRVTSYANGESTQTIKDIAITGGIFYALANQRDMVRIAANSPITPVALSGVPAEFLPQQFNAIMATDTEATLTFFDQIGQRLLVFSTDGSYRKQYTLPKGSNATDCALTTSLFYCTTEDKKLLTFNQ